ncbi:7-cyano-7-deazaguanine synthase QueC [Spongorhabdus nitratireducens]
MSELKARPEEKAVVIYSGGMDSFTVLNKAHKAGYELHALSFNYGQKHSKELEYAANVCASLGIPHKIVDITAINTLMSGSSLISNAEDEIPEGHYEEDNMKSTVVPNRNMILLSLATAYAISLKAGKVFYGAHSGDHTIYPDCRPEFVEAVNNVTKIADWQPVEIMAPYLYDSKIEILRDGLSMRLDYGQTWTCYNGREQACGKCGACQERLEAFELNNSTDPLSYE